LQNCQLKKAHVKKKRQKTDRSGKTAKHAKALPAAVSAVLDLKDNSVACRNIRIHGRRTSIRLDEQMWQALNEIAEIENCNIHDLCTTVYDSKDRDTGFTAALRIFLMNYYRMTVQNCDFCHCLPDRNGGNDNGST